MENSGREWIADAREQVCRQCGRQFRSLAKHWGRSAECTSRELSDHQHEIVRGLILGDGSLGGRETANLRVASVRRVHVEWLHDELGWLSRGITRFEHADTERWVYRLATMAHADLGRYVAWQEAPPKAGWELSRPVARVWYACDGSLSWSGRETSIPQVSFAAGDDRKCAALVAALERAGFEAHGWKRRLGLATGDVGAWFAWLGDPPPGSEHKWP